MMDVINKFISANEKMFKKDNLKSVYIVYIAFFVLILGLLPFAGGLIGISGIFITLFYSIAACVYNHKIIRYSTSCKKIFLSYCLLVGYLLIIFNLYLYGIPKIMKLNLDIFLILIIIYEFFCMALGCFYTYFSISRGKIKKYRPADALTISIIFILSVCWIVFFESYASATPNKMQAFITLATITICCCVITFYIGRIFIPMLYFLKKYKIDEFYFTNT